MRPRTLLVVSLIALSIVFVAVTLTLKSGKPAENTTFIPNELFHGEIDLLFIEQVSRHSQFVRYVVDLDKGLFTRRNDQGETHPDEEEGSRQGGHIDTCYGRQSLLVVSPNKKYVAYCMSDGEVLVAHGENQRVATIPLPEGCRVTGLSWSPGSDTIAVLMAKAHPPNPLARMLGLITSHPQLTVDFRLGLFSVAEASFLELPDVRKNSPYGWGTVRWVK